MRRNLMHSRRGLVGVSLCVCAGVAGAAIVTTNADSGAGSLRDAIASAAPNDTITFAANVTGKIVLTTGQILINKPLTISGPGAKVLTISAGGTSRIFVVSDGNPLTDSPVTIANLTLADGYVGNCTGAQVLANGGAVNSLESLTLTNVVVRDSFATSGGGGITFSPGKTGQALTIQGSDIVGNTAGCVGATNNAAGGGINTVVDSAGDPAINATVTIQDTRIERNIANRTGGGARFIVPGSTTLKNVRVRENSAGNTGGGIFIVYSSPFLTTTLVSVLVDDSEISGNQAGTSTIGGGGIGVNNDLPSAQGIGAGSTLTVRNSTISANQIRNGPGGGIAVNGNTTLVVQNSTITLNGAGQAAAAPSQAGGIYRAIGTQSGVAAANTEGTVTITSSIIANNRGTIGMEDLGQNTAETFANAIVLNQSLVRNTGTITPAPSGVGNITGQDPLLLPLADYGGPTFTHALGAGSPAIGAGSNPTLAATDQRGFTRTVGGTTDMGSFESGNVIPLGCLDADGNGTVDALTDGLLIVRASLGLTGASATANAIGSGAARATWSAIQAYLNGSCGASFSP